MLNRVSARLLAAFCLAIALAACTSDGPSRADVVAKIKSDPRTADTPPEVVDCLANWYMESAAPEVRTAFIEGKPPPESAAKKQDDAILECLKRAA
jgi:hypothetical protein